MFEKEGSRSNPTLWKIMPVAAAIVAGLALIFIFLVQSDQPEAEEVTGVLRKGAPDYEWYRKYVELKNPDIEMATNLAGSRLVTFSGLIENNGEKALDVVEVEAVFFNYEEPVHREIRTPLRPGPHSRPIPPLSARPFSFYVEDLPDDWYATHSEMSIHGFRFAKTGGE